MIFWITFVQNVKVQIHSVKHPGYILTRIEDSGGDTIRMIQEKDKNKHTAHNIVELEGIITPIKISDEHICGSKQDPSVVTCRKVPDDFIFTSHFDYKEIKTKDNYCLTVDKYDNESKGYFVVMNNCIGNEAQRFKLYDLGTVIFRSQTYERHHHDTDPDYINGIDYGYKYGSLGAGIAYSNNSGVSFSGSLSSSSTSSRSSSSSSRRIGYETSYL